jgi:hypothetical protein
MHNDKQGKRERDKRQALFEKIGIRSVNLKERMIRIRSFLKPAA